MLWGTLLIVSAAVELPSEGAATVLHRLLPERGASLWAWLNALAVPLAALVWVTAGALLLRGRRRD